jgi:hypothetical protein
MAAQGLYDLTMRLRECASLPSEACQLGAVPSPVEPTGGEKARC